VRGRVGQELTVEDFDQPAAGVTILQAAFDLLTEAANHRIEGRQEALFVLQHLLGVGGPGLGLLQLLPFLDNEHRGFGLGVDPAFPTPLKLGDHFLRLLGLLLPLCRLGRVATPRSTEQPGPGDVTLLTVKVYYTIIEWG
jgi:hypothetical protein